MTMRDPFVSVSAPESPAKDSLKNVEGCYNNNIFGYYKTLANSRQVLRSGAERITKTFRTVRKTFGNISQQLRFGGRRRHRLSENGTPNKLPSTPTNKKIVLGRSPAKLYSPFGIETPHSRDFRMSPYMPDTPDGLSPKHRKGVGNTWRVLAKRPRALFD